MRILVVLVATCCASVADARPAASGWYAEGGLGATGFLPSHSDDARPGPGLHLALGRDVFNFLALGLSFTASSHEATVPPPPEGEWFQLYRGLAEARIGGRFDTIAVFVEGGAGVSMISSNVLGKVMVTESGENFSILFQAGAGAEYQLENRHYAIGAAVDAFLLPQFDAMRAIDARLYLRYTY
ncbi:MAG TPA: outer membrane beta-barrel protein [Kofleriaceae bacterium]|nr:outer membrane beta-barrel protein [Kofleriaceae bacterium]